MQCTLITKSGKIMQFYIKEVAELYKVIYGGAILTEKKLDTDSKTCYNDLETEQEIDYGYTE